MHVVFNSKETLRLMLSVRDTYASPLLSILCVNMSNTLIITVPGTPRFTRKHFSPQFRHYLIHLLPRHIPHLSLSHARLDQHTLRVHHKQDVLQGLRNRFLLQISIDRGQGLYHHILLSRTNETN
jgi:hypothetical protein